MRAIKLTLPPVPSLNHVYRNVRINCRIMMPEGKAWQSQVWNLALTAAKNQGWLFSKNEKLVMELKFFWPDKRKRDCDNCLKLLSDTLEGLLFENDRWLLPRVMDWNVDKKFPRVEVHLYPKEDQ